MKYPSFYLRLGWSSLLAYVEKIIRRKKILQQTCGNRVPCDENGRAKTFAIKHSLGLHKKMVHQKMKQQKKVSCCRICQREFAGTSNLKRHLRLIHNANA